jgi:hypothetical protein
LEEESKGGQWLSLGSVAGVERLGDWEDLPFQFIDFKNCSNYL